MRDAAVGALVEQLKEDDLATAVARAQTIEETALRYSILEPLATH